MDINEKRLIENEVSSLRQNEFADFERIYVITKKVMANAALPDADFQITNATQHALLATKAQTLEEAELEIIRARRHILFGSHVCYCSLLQFEQENARDYLEAAKKAYGYINYDLRKDMVLLNKKLNGLKFLPEPDRSESSDYLNNDCIKLSDANLCMAEYYSEFLQFHKAFHGAFPLEEVVLTAKQVKSAQLREWAWENFIILGIYAFIINVSASVAFEYVVKPLIELLLKYLGKGG